MAKPKSLMQSVRVMQLLLTNILQLLCLTILCKKVGRLFTRLIWTFFLPKLSVGSEFGFEILKPEAEVGQNTLRNTA